LLLDTKRVLRRRRRLKQAGWVAALAACYFAGLGSSRIGSPRFAPHVLEAQNRADTRSPDAVSSPHAPVTVITQASVPLDDDPDVPAIVFERIAAAADVARRSLLFRRAGDRYLDGSDEDAAIRCYRRALDNAPERDLAISPDDNWLLIALKKARQEGKSHVDRSS
jgi:hypothetical protein